MSAPLSATYSFQDVQAGIVAPSATFDLKSAGVSAEGIRVAMLADKDTMTIGANGDGMHSLAASKAGRIQVSLLKTAPGNAMLNSLYRYQSLSAATWGQIQLTVSNPVSGDSITARGGAFQKQSDLGYMTEGNLNVWAFNFVDIDETLGKTGLSTAA